MVLDGDMGAEIAALAVQQGTAQQNIDNQAIGEQDSVEDQAEQAEVQTMHEQATETRNGAIASGALQIGGGLCSMGAGGLGMSSLKNAASLSTMMKGGSEAFVGGGTIAGGLGQAAATDSAALAAAQKSAGDAANRAGQTDRSAQKSASDFVESAIEFYREYETAKAQAAAAALHGS
jgi:hypothetical protein